MTELQKEVDRLGAKLSPDLRAFVDRVIIPALLREYLAEKRETGNCFAIPSVANSEPDKRLSAEGIR